MKSILLALCLFVCPAFLLGADADEIWVCAKPISKIDKTPVVAKYKISGTELTDVTSDAFSKVFSSDPPKYQVLENTPDGIVAVESEADKDTSGSVAVWLSVILINKHSGDLREASLGVGDEYANDMRGQCELK